MFPAGNVKNGIENSRFSLCDMSPSTGHVISCCREAINYRSSFSLLIDKADELNISYPPSTPKNLFSFTKSIQMMLLAGLEETFQELVKEDNKRIQSASSSSAGIMNKGNSNATLAHAHALYEGGQEQAEQRYLMSMNQYAYIVVRLMLNICLLFLKKNVLSAY
jgi:hypothetical protein